MRKWIMILACLVLVCTLFLGLAGVGSAAAKKDVTLTFWSWRTEDVDAYTKFIQVFNKKNPNINVKFIPYKNTEYNTILSTALQGGSGPDIMQLRAYGGMEPLANAGYLRALDGLVPEMKGFDTNVLQGARSRKDQKIDGVPFAVHARIRRHRLPARRGILGVLHKGRDRRGIGRCIGTHGDLTPGRSD